MLTADVTAVLPATRPAPPVNGIGEVMLLLPFPLAVGRGPNVVVLDKVDGEDMPYAVPDVG